MASAPAAAPPPVAPALPERAGEDWPAGEANDGGAAATGAGPAAEANGASAAAAGPLVLENGSTRALCNGARGLPASCTALVLHCVGWSKAHFGLMLGR